MRRLLVVQQEIADEVGGIDVLGRRELLQGPGGKTGETSPGKIFLLPPGINGAGPCSVKNTSMHWIYWQGRKGGKTLVLWNKGPAGIFSITPKVVIPKRAVVAAGAQTTILEI